MDAVFYVLTTMIGASLALTAVFLMAWKSMGHKKYIMYWAIAFFLTSIQRAINLIYDWFDSFTVYWMIVCTLSIVTVTYGYLGHALRTKRQNVAKPAWAIGALTVILTYVFTDIYPHTGLSMSIYIYHNVLYIALVGWFIYRFRPAPLPAEIGAALTYFLLAVGQFIAGTIALWQGGTPNDELAELYRAINYITLPAAYVAMGTFVVFILASDLAEELKDLAMTDPLTHCLNRRGFFAKAQSHATRFMKNSQHVSLIYWDIDHFKSINDKYGHAAGDQVLTKSVDIVKSNVKSRDLIARLGGEEFVILLISASAKEARDVAERLRAKLENTPISAGNDTINITASFGAVDIKVKDFLLERIIDTADAALYEAKNSGRNQVVFADK